ncbi:MAG: response regulator transcription factor [Thermodesulfobacteriota bacterium]|nr:response regulator transcription factor [Thermodesulfobacteriota bacterium]
MAGDRLVYIAEDEVEIADMVVRYLEKEGFEAKAFYRGDRALEEILRQPPDLAIIDVMMPGMNGLDLTREIRKLHLFPIIFLTSRKDEVDRILGLEMGADDYVTKPFSPRELITRVRTLFRRIEFTRQSLSRESGARSTVESHGLTLDLSRRKLFFGKESTELTAIEFSLLEHLMKAPGRVFTRDELIEAVWGKRSADPTRSLDVHIRNLRQKLEALMGTGDMIRGIRGVGYAFED